MNMLPEPIPFRADWPDADTRFLRVERPEPPKLPLERVFSPGWAAWIRSAAESKGAPPDYVMAALLSICGALIGNSRWSSPWQSWAEPPVVWSAIIGNPSAGKTPGIDAVLDTLKRIERTRRAAAQVEIYAWREKADVADLAEKAWKDDVKAAIKAGEEPPARPPRANAGPEPALPRLVISDSTVQQLAAILAAQPRWTLLARDELAGWLQSMGCYSGGGADRQFWLEATGGRSYSVERVGRASIYVDHLTIGVLGGVQPDKLTSLLLNSEDDGLLARLLPVWPYPAPIKRPSMQHDDAFLENALNRLLSLEMSNDDNGHLRPWLVPFEEQARDGLDDLRKFIRSVESSTEGLLLSYLGKLPGTAVRLSLVLALIDWASREADMPAQIGKDHFGRAANLVKHYLLPMARRTYAEQSGSRAERSARALVALIREERWLHFTARDVRRKQRSHLQGMEMINPALHVMETADLIRPVAPSAGPKGGTPKRLFSVNPILLE